MKYPRLLSSGANNKLIALTETEMAKLFTCNTRSDIGSEAEKMKYANTINGLVVKFIHKAPLCVVCYVQNRRYLLFFVPLLFK